MSNGQNLAGFKTVATGAAMVVLPPLVQYVGGIDWTKALPASVVWAAPMVSGAIMLVLRWFTNTPVFQQSASVNPADPRLGGLQ